MLSASLNKTFPSFLPSYISNYICVCVCILFYVCLVCQCDSVLYVDGSGLYDGNSALYVGKSVYSMSVRVCIICQ